MLIETVRCDQFTAEVQQGLNKHGRPILKVVFRQDNRCICEWYTGYKLEPSDATALMIIIQQRVFDCPDDDYARANLVPFARKILTVLVRVKEFERLGFLNLEEFWKV
ncbi:MAG: hypothetical protein HYT83_02435 [Candidatus Levybacteria bacterium]|nr:hypothetical protein [Candidatus Levybacteria bacterium]